MSDTAPELVTLVYLVLPGQGYAPVHLPKQNFTLTPGQPFEAHPRIAKQLLAAHPETIAVVSFEMPAAAAKAATKAEKE